MERSNVPNASAPATLNPEPRTLNSINFSHIPDQLKLAPRWLLWRYRPGRDGPLGKIPFRPCGRRANPADSRSWTTFHAVAATFQRHLHTKVPYDGIAFALGDGFAAVELSAVFDESDYLLPWAANLVDDLATYTELSPDSDGLSLFVSGTFDGRNIEPVSHPAGGTIALSQHDRFLCITGDSWHDPSPLPLADGTQQLRHLAYLLRTGNVAAAVPSRLSGVPLTGARALKIEVPDQELRKASGHGETPNTKHQTRTMHQEAPPATFKNSAHPDAERPDAERVADQIVELALTDFRLGRTPTDETFAVPLVGPNMAYMLRGGSTPLRKALARQFRRRHGRTLSSSALNDALNVIDAEAGELEPEEVALRVAHLPLTPPASDSLHSTTACTLEPSSPSTLNPESRTLNADGIVIDLGRPDGRAVAVTPDGWRIVDRSPVLFRRTSLNAQLPLPVPGGSLDQLRSFVNVDDEGYQMLRGWLVAALFPSIAHPILALRGAQGTGKTTALGMLAGLVDPSSALTLSEPNDSENWVLMAHGVWCIALDNVAGFSPRFSESLCRAVTGQGVVRRRLHTDGDYAVIAFRRVLALTCIKLGPIAEDLAARMLPVRLELIEKTARLSETRLLARFEAQKPQLFGALLDEVAATLRNLPTVQLEELPRMADFARLLAALPTAPMVPSTLNPEPPTLNSPLAIYLRLIDQLSAEVAEGDPMAAAVSEFMSTRDAWQGTATELLALLPRPEDSRGWPKTGQYLTVRLNDTAPSLRSMGIVINHTRTTDKARTRLVELKTIPTQSK